MRVAQFCVGVLGLVVVSADLGAQVTIPDKYEIDPAHSSVSFAVRFMGLTTIRGAFAQYAGTVMYSAANPSRSSVTSVIEVSSINTNNGQRDHDLQGVAFFDAQHFPFITFRSSVAVPTKQGFELRGALTIRGVTHEVSIPVTPLHPAMSDAWGNTRVGFVGTLIINRKDYGVLGTAFWNREFDPGRMSIGDSISIELSIEGLRPNYDKWNTPGADSLAQVAIERGPAAIVPPVGTSTSVDAYIVAGLKLESKGRAAAAAHLFEIASRLAPTAANVLTYLGDARRALGQDSAARAAYRGALQLDSLDTSATESLRWMTSPQ